MLPFMTVSGSNLCHFFGFESQIVLVYLYCVVESRGQVVNTRTSYLEGPRFKFWCGDWLL